MFFYYVPSAALISPLGLQTLCVAVGTTAGSQLVVPKTSALLGVWSLSTLIDLAFTLAILFVVYPIFAVELVGEPDGTTNVYMAWIPLCFQAYLTLGFISAVCSMIGICASIRCATRHRTSSLRVRQSFLGLVALAMFASLLLLTLGCIDIGTGLMKIPPASSHAIDDSQCDPLIPSHCGLPFPSSFWTSADTTTVTGQRLNVKGSVPSTRWSTSHDLGAALNKRSFSRHDGFSTVAPVLFGFEHEVNINELVQASNISVSVNKQESTTFLINRQTGELIPHFVEKDYFDQSFGETDSINNERTVLILQPAKGLEHNATYVVAVVSGKLRYKSSNQLVPRPTQGYFAALRDDLQNDPLYDPKRATAMSLNVWPALLKAGIDRTNLLLAFSFTTVSRTASLGRFEQIRDSALQYFEHLDLHDDDTVIRCSITKVVESSTKCSDYQHTTIAKTLHGHFMSPNYLVHPGPSAISGFIDPDETGKYPHPNGFSQVNFLIRVPCSVYNGSRTVSTILQYGHGLFGSRGEAKNEYLGNVANKYGALIVATDWKGMSRYDIPMALRIFTKKIEEFASMPERTQQGWIDNQLFLRLLRNGNIGMRNSTFLRTGMGDQFIAKTTPISYYGNSQGSIIGGGYFSSSLDLTHAVLGVPGTPFSLLLSRSKDFAPYHAAMKFQVWNAIDVRIYLSMLQNIWDAGESAGWLTNIIEAGKPQRKETVATKYPEKFVLLQAAIGDAQVTTGEQKRVLLLVVVVVEFLEPHLFFCRPQTVAGEFMARSLKASTIHPETRFVYGVPERTAPWKAGAGTSSKSGSGRQSGRQSGSKNGFVEWKYDDAPPIRRDRDVPPTDGKDTHECPRREPKAQEQLYNFLVLHQIVQTCEEGKICESKKCPSGHSNN